MEAVAVAKHIRQSPKKIRFVLDAVRGKNVNDALVTLEFMNKKAAGHILKTLKSAIANMSSKDESYNHDALRIKKAFVDEGPVMKRWHAAAMGRATQILKRTSHLTIVISDDNK